MICEACKHELPSGSKFCPNCGGKAETTIPEEPLDNWISYDTQQQTSEQTPKKKNAKLPWIFGILLIFIGATSGSVAAFIFFAIAGALLLPPVVGRLPKLKKWIRIAAIPVCIIIGFALRTSFAEGVKDGISAGMSTDAVEMQEATNDIAATSEPVKQSGRQIGEGDVGDYHVVIEDATLGEDSDGNYAAIVSYKLTNNSEKATKFMLAISDKCYQDGIECSSAFVDDINSGADSMIEIEPGATHEMKQAYRINPSKPINIEVRKLLTLSDIDVVTKTFDAWIEESEYTPEITHEPTPEPGAFESMAIVHAKNYIEKILKAPSTAKFPFWPDQYRVVWNEAQPNRYKVEGYVDAENSFGAMIRSDFIIIMEFESRDYSTPVYIQFDGEVVYDSEE